ncbi:F-box protein-like protein [Hapsidospora chrysogenum ATCC 11550]|uniref:F-box protein-like protein n=1 Tax=Hapsidospora chrysogenum (strain ATCC 11550 / CBS 779.69 / DSM 880 / IAM 14645 / JCM 23072 / IMI 49137) TaxID=857340 RepID=A0A086THB9_HAPC1|nr:F-box protein-like protein [Hapsidospora chrysogenum ATCC 11550]
MLMKASLTGALSPSEKTARSSFSSVRENDDGLAQTFTRSKVSSYTNDAEEVFDESPSSELSQHAFHAPLTQPNSKLHGFWAPAPTFRGWREIPLKGKKASSSFENLRNLCMTWSPSSTPTIEKPKKTTYSPGQSPLETLPSEVLSAIIDLLVVELPPNGLTTRNADLMALLMTSRSLHATTLNTLYRHITIPHSRIFRKFLTTVTQYPSLASIVRRLDFSHFNPSTIFSSASERAQTRNLTAETLARCLELTPYLQEFLAQEYVDDDLGPEVLRKLFFGLPRLQAVDFCGCSSVKFRDSFRAVLEDHWPDSLNITRLSFHKCLSLPSAVFDTILPRLHRVTHLDVAGTRVTDAALESIPPTARITHLNLAKCKGVSSEAIIKFITTHPAVKDSLVFLSLATDASTHLLLGKHDIETILPILPPTLRSLSLKGSRMDPSHIALLQPLTQTLEELALGGGLELSDVHQLFYCDKEWKTHNLRYLDISDIETRLGSASDLLAANSAPLQVIEVGERGYERAAKVRKSLESVGWTPKEFGSRYWLVRLNADGTTHDNGGRWWKLGAESWGMRKIPVAIAEVGGMYGSFMFGRRL